MLLSNSEWLVFTTIHIIIWIMIYRYKMRFTDPLDSFYFSSGLYLLIFVYAPAVWIARGQTSYQGVEVMSYMPIGMLVFNIGYFIFALGSISNKKIVIGHYGRHNRYADQEFTTYLYSDEIAARITRWGWVVYIISISLALLYFAKTGRSLVYMLTLGQGDEITIGGDALGTYFLAQFSRSAIPAIVLILTFQKRNKLSGYAAVYVLAAICFTSGSRNLALCVVISIAVMHYLKRDKRPNLFAMIAAAMLMFLFVGFVGTYRQVMRKGGTIDLSLLSFEGMLNAFMFNVEIFFPFFNIVGYTYSGQMSCHYGLGILNIPIQFIPRALWASKPATLGLTAFQAMYGDSFGGSAYPNIGEFFYELGVFGVILFMYIFGKRMKQLYTQAVYTRNPLAMIRYSIAFGYIMQFICRGHFASWALDFAFMFMPLVFVEQYLYGCYCKQHKFVFKEGE